MKVLSRSQFVGAVTAWIVVAAMSSAAHASSPPTPPVVPAPAVASSFVDWARTQGYGVENVACTTSAPAVCYGTVVDAFTVIGAFALSPEEPVWIMLSPAAPTPGAATTTTVVVVAAPTTPTTVAVPTTPTTVAVPTTVLSRDAELAVRDCLGGLFPTTTTIVRQVREGDDSALQEAQDLCGEAHRQLQVEPDSQLTSEMDLCVTGFGVQIGLLASATLLGVVDEAQIADFEAVAASDGAVLAGLLEGVPGSCTGRPSA